MDIDTPPLSERELCAFRQLLLHAAVELMANPASLFTESYIKAMRAQGHEPMFPPELNQLGQKIERLCDRSPLIEEIRLELQEASAGARDLLEVLPKTGQAFKELKAVVQKPRKGQ